MIGPVLPLMARARHLALHRDTETLYCYKTQICCCETGRGSQLGSQQLHWRFFFVLHGINKNKKNKWYWLTTWPDNFMDHQNICFQTFTVFRKGYRGYTTHGLGSYQFLQAAYYCHRIASENLDLARHLSVAGHRPGGIFTDSIIILTL